MARRTLLLSVAAVALLGPVSAPAARAAQRFDGASRGGSPAVLELTATRATFDVGVRGRCSGGTPFVSGIRGEADVGKDDTFSSVGRGRRGDYGSRHGRYLLVLRARRRADTVRGTVRVSFRAGGFSCGTGNVPFVAHADGSPGAPFRDGRAATGRYTAAGQGVFGLRAGVFLPARRLRTVTFSWRVRCEGKRPVFLRGYETFSARTLFRGRVVVGGRRSVPLARGRVSHEAYRLGVRLFMAGGLYRIAGAWRVRAAVTRGDRVVYRCSTRGLGFTGRYRGR